MSFSVAATLRLRSGAKIAAAGTTVAYDCLAIAAATGDFAAIFAIFAAAFTVRALLGAGHFVAPFIYAALDNLCP